MKPKTITMPVYYLILSDGRRAGFTLTKEDADQIRGKMYDGVVICDVIREITEVSVFHGHSHEYGVVRCDSDDELVPNVFYHGYGWKCSVTTGKKQRVCGMCDRRIKTDYLLLPIKQESE